MSGVRYVPPRLTWRPSRKTVKRKDVFFRSGLQLPHLRYCGMISRDWIRPSGGGVASALAEADRARFCTSTRGCDVWKGNPPPLPLPTSVEEDSLARLIHTPRVTTPAHGDCLGRPEEERATEPQPWAGLGPFWFRAQPCMSNPESWALHKG